MCDVRLQGQHALAPRLLGQRDDLLDHLTGRLALVKQEAPHVARHALELVGRHGHQRDAEGAAEHHDHALLGIEHGPLAVGGPVAHVDAGGNADQAANQARFIHAKRPS